METSIRLFFFSFIFLASCTKKLEIIEYGKTNFETLVKLKGEPQKSISTPIKDSSIHHFSNNEKYQVKEKIVIAAFRDPVESEKTLLFWKDRFKNCHTIERKISNFETEFACPASGETVVYQPEFGVISRVIEYEKK